jgi:Derlin-2/3
MNRQPAQVGGSDSISDWYKEVPLVTKLLVTCTVASTSLVFCGIFTPSTFAFAWELIWRKFHFWRLFSPFIYSHPFSFDFAMHTYMLYEYCQRYEKNPFNTGGGGNSADFLWMILLGMAAICVVAYFFGLSLMSNPLLFMIMYVWSRREPEMIMSMFTFKYKALYCPWVSLGIYIIMGASITLPFIGISVGHVYYFLTTELPDIHGFDLIRTPEFCIKAVKLYTGNSAPSGVAYTASAPAPAAAAGGTQFPNLGAGHQWGRGRALGSD